VRLFAPKIGVGRIDRSTVNHADRLLCGEVVLVEQAAESVSPGDARLGVTRQEGRPLEKRRSLFE
jgi:hypothetical protein